VGAPSQKGDRCGNRGGARPKALTERVLGP